MDPDPRDPKHMNPTDPDPQHWIQPTEMHSARRQKNTLFISWHNPFTDNFCDLEEEKSKVMNYYKQSGEGQIFFPLCNRRFAQVSLVIQSVFVLLI